MILPFTTNQWNAVRFVTLNLISVPLIELALHRLHQLGVANRMLRGRKTRVRPSFLANWGLHQEVDELSVRSRITALIVAFCYVAFSLYTEYASGSKQVPKKCVWEPPVLPRSLLRDKPALFDTTLMPVGPFIGCRSKKSREKLQQLLEHTVNVKVHRRVYKKIAMTLDGATVNFTRAHFENTGGEENGRIQLVLNPSVRNSYHVAFTLRKDAGYYAEVAEMHDEVVCFRLKLFNRFVCLSNSENITLSMVLGNIVLFGGSLPNAFSELSYLTLPSASAFHFGCVPIEQIGKSICDAFALARTPCQFSNALIRVPRSYRDLFWLNPRFKYDFGAANNA